MWRAAPFNLFLGVVAFARLPTYSVGCVCPLSCAINRYDPHIGDPTLNYSDTRLA